MKTQIKMLFSILVSISFITGCATTVQVTSDPSGARVYNAQGYGACGLADRGFRPYDYVKGIYRGDTPVTYVSGFNSYDNVRVVWPDGEDSGWKQQPITAGIVGTFHFKKRNTAMAQSPSISRRSPSSLPASNATSEKLAVLKTLLNDGDISEEEYHKMRATILASLTSMNSQSRGSKVLEASDAGEVRRSAVDKGRDPIISAPISIPRLQMAARIEDDPVKGGAIMGNGDGLIQKGEAFNLVVVVSNTTTSTVKVVACTVTLPTDKSVKAYSELHFAISKLAPAAAVTNRFSLAMPVNVMLTKAPVCRIEIKEEGPFAAEHLNYQLPMDVEYP